MPRIVVMGGGVCGLAAGILLRRDGHEVIVLERDAEPAPASADDAWERWSRQGVAQFHQPHYLLPRGREVLDGDFPEVAAELARSGALRFDSLSLMPPSIADRAPRAGDERFLTLTARRPVIERAFARVAERVPGLEVRRGVTVRELVLGAYDGIPHVRGVRTDDGGELTADLVVDALGRRSPTPSWLERAGARPVPEEAEDSAFIYYTRYYRSRDGAAPEFRAALTTPVGTFSLLTLPCDNGTWSITIFISAGDRPLKRVREPELFTAVIAACPRHAQLLDGEPITGVLAMGGTLDRLRRFIAGGQPVATGIVPVADACACTNPSLGRGITLGLLHVRRLPAVIRDHLDQPRRLAEAWGAATEAELTPWYRDTITEDRARFAQIEALRAGRAPDPPSGPGAERRAALAAAVPHDPDAFRAFLGWRSCLATLDELLADQRLAERVLDIAGHTSGPPPLAGPDRRQLLDLLHGSSPVSPVSAPATIAPR